MSRHVKKQENRFHIQEGENKTQPKITEVMDLINKNVKTSIINMLQTLKNAEEKMIMMRETEDNKQDQIGFLVKTCVKNIIDVSKSRLDSQ